MDLLRRLRFGSYKELWPQKASTGGRLKILLYKSLSTLRRARFDTGSVVVFQSQRWRIPLGNAYSTTVRLLLQQAAASTSIGPGAENRAVDRGLEVALRRARSMTWSKCDELHPTEIHLSPVQLGN